MPQSWLACLFISKQGIIGVFSEFNVTASIILNPVTLLQQNLAIEHDLQNFIAFIHESVRALDGNIFAATLTTLNLMQKLRSAGAASGHPLPTSLLLTGRQLQVTWENQHLTIVNFDQLPQPDTVAQLKLHLHNSTAATDPAILLQRNAEMARHLAEVRTRTEKELSEMQHNLKKHKAELHESMQRAETDPLTGLLNRRAFDDKLGRAFHHAMRQRNTPLSLVLLDIDFFKSINDQFGHQFGDSYLIKMAKILHSVIRDEVDFAFRFGGDEFAIVIFADYQLACDKAWQVLQLMENRVSIGITDIPPDTPDWLTVDEFIRRADHALYEAKHCGRGRIVVDLCLSPGEECQQQCPKNSPPSHGRLVEFKGRRIPRCQYAVSQALQPAPRQHSLKEKKRLPPKHG